MIQGKLLRLGIGILVFLTIVLTFSFFFHRSNQPKIEQLSVAEAVQKIKNGQIKETNFKNLKVVLVDQNGQIAEITQASETERELLWKHILDFNNENTKRMIKLTREPAPAGRDMTVLLNSKSLAVGILVMWGATLAVIVYAVRALSRNRG